MGDNVKSLRKANDNLKRQLQDLATDFQTFKNKMAEKNEAAIASLPTENDVQYLSDGYDALVQTKTNMVEDLQKLSRRLDILTENVTRIDKAIDEMLFYSYQYNVKIVGVPHVSENESSEETVELCVKLFSALGVETPISDIDIAHRVPQRNNMSSNGRRRPNPIICKFTRRMTREKVLAAKSNTSSLTVDNLGLPTTATVDRIAIYSHLTPKLQELLYAAKDHQKSFSYKWCWAKGAAVYLRKTDTSASLRLRSTNDLVNLRARESSPSDHQSRDD